MPIELLGPPVEVSVIAVGPGIRERRRLVRAYGRGRWRKLKGFARVRLPTGQIVSAEVHWYEASGIGRRELKIKRILEER